MTITLKPSRAQLILASIRSLLTVTFGYVLFDAMPVPIGPLVLSICCLVALLGAVEAVYDRLEITESAITFRTVFKQWSVPLTDIQDWKIKGGDRSHSLHIVGKANQLYFVPNLSSYGVREPNLVAKTIAQHLAQSKTTTHKQT
jgi:hypothetical protein